MAGPTWEKSAWINGPAGWTMLSGLNQFLWNLILQNLNLGGEVRSERRRG